MNADQGYNEAISIVTIAGAKNLNKLLGQPNGYFDDTYPFEYVCQNSQNRFLSGRSARTVSDS